MDIKLIQKTLIAMLRNTECSCGICYEEHCGIQSMIELLDKIDSDNFLEIIKNQLWQYEGKEGHPTWGELAQALEDYLKKDN